MLAVGRELPGRPEDHPLLEPPSFGRAIASNV